jgi:predicted enzyme related to lactoylglutathione lyase
LCGTKKLIELKTGNGMIYFEIQADDLSRAREFYTNVFAWKFQKAEGLPVEYWHIQTGDNPGGLLKRPAQTPPSKCGTNAFVCSFRVKDFDKSADLITELGGQIAMPKFLIPGKCWQGYFLDTEGNTFGAYQVVEGA